jgi:hypothetical protein
VGATATSGSAQLAVDGLNDFGVYTVWQSIGALPQSVTVDIGQVRPDVGILNSVPRYVAQRGPSTDGNITGYNILVSTDGTTFTNVATGTWAADGKMKTVTFGPVPARYIQLEATSANGAAAAVTEISVGAHP